MRFDSATLVANTIVSGSFEITGTTTPGDDLSYDLGTASKRWRSSKILVFGHMVTGYTSTVTQAFYKLKRNGVDVGNGTPTSNPGVIARSYTADVFVNQTDAYFYLDSPNTTSSLTYQIFIGSEAVNGTVYVNRTQTDSSRGASSITVMEIAQ